MKPADEVGGDYYDVIHVNAGASRLESGELPLHSDPFRHWLVIGDVSGHGVPAGLVMMMVQTSIRTALDKSPQGAPAEILETVDRIIHYRWGTHIDPPLHCSVFSIERLTGVLRNLGARPAIEIRDGVLSALAGYSCPDDVTLLLLKRVPVCIPTLSKQK